MPDRELEDAIDSTLRLTGVAPTRVLGLAAAVLTDISDAGTEAAAAQADATQALADAAAAQSTADTANTAAGAAQTTANTANTTANTATTNLATHTATAWAHGGTLAQLNSAVSDADVPALAGQLGGTAASPDVRGLRETGGPSLVTIGAIPDGSFLRRSTTTIAGISENDMRTLLLVPQPSILTGPSDRPGTNITATSQRAYAMYIGYLPAGWQFNYATFRLATVASGAGQAEVAIASSAAAPALRTASATSTNLTILAAQTTEDLTAGAAGARRNSTTLGYTLAANTHVWALFRCQYATTQATFVRVTNNSAVYELSQTKDAVADLTTLVDTTVSSWSVSTEVCSLFLSAS